MNPFANNNPFAKAASGSSNNPFSNGAVASNRPSGNPASLAQGGYGGPGNAMVGGYGSPGINAPRGNALPAAGGYQAAMMPVPQPHLGPNVPQPQIPQAKARYSAPGGFPPANSVSSGAPGSTTVQYYSASHNQWIDTGITESRGDGAVMLACKPGYWLSPDEQKQKLRAKIPQAPRHSVEPIGTAGSGAPRPSVNQLCLIQNLLNSPFQTASQARHWFSKFDKDRNGYLNYAELTALCNELNNQVGIPNADEATMLAVFRQFDKDQNGGLDYLEFYDLYHRLLIRCKERFAQFKVRRDFFLEKQSGSPDEHYQVIKQLGKGTFGTAYLVTDKRSGNERVLKTVNKAKAQMPPEELEKEIKSLKQLDHPHIIKLFEYYEDFHNIYIIMETAHGGELLEVIQKNYQNGFRLTEDWVATVMQQVLEAIAYCHKRSLMHKDLKAENIMLLTANDTTTAPHAVVIDLGIAEMFTAGGRSAKCCGTPYTMAPEVWESALGGRGFGPKCDVFSLGVVLFQLLTGSLPYQVQTTDPRMWLGILQQPPPMQRMAGCTQEAQQLVLSMLTFIDERRPDAQQCLGFPWFQLAAKSNVGLSPDVMQHICNFGRKNALEKAVCNQIASQMAAKDVPHLNAVFREVDKDNTGCLSPDELKLALAKLGVDVSSAKNLAETLDLDGDGRIEYSEFVAACLETLDSHFDNMLWQAFKKFDKDGSGTLDINELRSLLMQGQLQGVGWAPTEQDIKGFMSAMDKDKNGRVTFEEFRHYILRAK